MLAKNGEQQHEQTKGIYLLFSSIALLRSSIVTSPGTYARWWIRYGEQPRGKQTIFPSFMSCWIMAPFFGSFLISERSSSPAERWTKPKFLTKSSDCVPFPAPGPPSTKTTSGLDIVRRNKKSSCSKKFDGKLLLKNTNFCCSDDVDLQPKH